MLTFHSEHLHHNTSFIFYGIAIFFLPSVIRREDCFFFMVVALRPIFLLLIKTWIIKNITTIVIITSSLMYVVLYKALWDHLPSYKAAVEKSSCRFRALMSKPEARVARKNSLRSHKEETRFKTEPILMWETVGGKIRNHYASTVVCLKDVLYEPIVNKSTLRSLGRQQQLLGTGLQHPADSSAWQTFCTYTHWQYKSGICYCLTNRDHGSQKDKPRNLWALGFSLQLCMFFKKKTPKTYQYIT